MAFLVMVLLAGIAACAVLIGSLLDGHAWMRRAELEEGPTRPAWATIPPAPVRTMPNTYSHAIRVVSHRTDRKELDR